MEIDNEVDWVTRQYSSNTTAESTGRALAKAGVDGNYFSCVIPNEDARAHAPPEGHIIAFFTCLESRMTLPLHAVIKELCAYHRISPIQLSLKFWATYALMLII